MTFSIGAQSKVARPDSAVRRFATDFWLGFRDLAPLSLAVGTAAFVVSLVALLWLFSPRTMAGPWGDYIPKSPTSADAFVTVEAIRVGQTEPKNPQVLILGSSTLAQAFGRAEILERELETGTGTKWDVKMLTTPLQSPLDKLALLETALANRTEESPHTVVVIGAGMQRLTWTPERTIERSNPPRIGLRSSWADEELVLLGGTPEPQSGFYALDNRRFVLLNGLAAMTRVAVQKPANRRIDVFARGEPTTVKMEWISGRIIASQENLPGFLEQHQRIMQRIASVPNTTLVFVDEPLLPDPAQSKALHVVAARFAEGMQNLADAQDGYYWPVIAESELKPDDYFDPLHLFRGKAQEACQATLANRLVDLAMNTGMVNG